MTITCPKCDSDHVDNVGDGVRALCLRCDHEWTPPDDTSEPPPGWRWAEEQLLDGTWRRTGYCTPDLPQLAQLDRAWEHHRAATARAVARGEDACAEAVERAVTDDRAQRTAACSPDDLRALGFEVTTHIDYQHLGQPRVFWCLTLGSLAFKATGASDAEALDEIRRQAAEFDERARGSDAIATERMISRANERWSSVLLGATVTSVDARANTVTVRGPDGIEHTMQLGAFELEADHG